MAQGTATKVKTRKKSVLKRAAQSIQRAAVKRSDRSELRSLIKSLRRAMRTGDPAVARQAAPANDFRHRPRGRQGRSRTEYGKPP